MVTDIRRIFLDFFVQHQHQHLPSSSLVPAGDSTLLFANAGMNQFKDVFLGKEKPSSPRVTTVQKCMRAGGKHNDLENVGYTRRHHTFFEMLGNFSFGDYFKEKAIEMAWALITQKLAIAPERLYVTVFTTDDEAYRIWNQHIGVDPKRIFRFGEKDNFWAMGETGPCGPCSEIYVDTAFDGKTVTRDEFEKQSDRFLEIWNLVFMEFLQRADGREKLPKPSIDTGMGLERVTAVLTGAASNYDTPLFTPILKLISKASSRDYFSSKNEPEKISQKVIADHIRAMTFLIADGVLPSKDGRGYVLRRIMRRAMRHGKKIDFPFEALTDLSQVVVENYSQAYPELLAKKNLIGDVIKAEANRFSDTVDRGLVLLQTEIENIKKAGGKTLPGSIAFHLYDTYGFPADLTADVLREQNLGLDQSGFDQAFENHREKARGSWKGSRGKEIEALVAKWTGQGVQTQFLGYESLDAKGTVLSLVEHGKEMMEAFVDQEIEVLADRTPFYGESGGQVGDIGSIVGDGFVLEVIDTIKASPNIILHRAKVVEGKVKPKMTAEFRVDAKARAATAKNHTATHMLHATLREILGDHVAQKGSLVAPERLRFDFTHSSAVSPDQLMQIEEVMNQRIWANSKALVERLPYQKALETGAVALFGEKYGDEVRVLSIGDYSKELCGGTHLAQTGDIGLFKIVKESSVSAGIRRIEAFTSFRALRFLQELQNQSVQLAQKLGVPADKVNERIEKMLHAPKESKKSISSSAILDGGRVSQVAGVSLFEQIVQVQDPKDLRDLADRAMEKIIQGLVVLGATFEEKVFIVVKVSKDLTHRWKAGDLVKQAAVWVGGSGGGRDDFAQAGGAKLDGLPDAIQKIKERVAGQ